MKKQLATTLVAAALLVAPTVHAPVYANDSANHENASISVNPTKYLKFKLNAVQAELFGQAITLDTPPQLIGDTTMVPVRVIAEALGAEVSWDNELQLITIVKETNSIQIALRQTNAIVNGETKELEQSAQLLADSTFVPLRFIAESLQQQVEFDPVEQAIYIRHAEKKPIPKTPIPQASSTEGTALPIAAAPAPVPAPPTTPTPSPMKRLSKPSVEWIKVNNQAALTNMLDFIVDRDNQLYVLNDGQGGQNTEKIYRIDVSTKSVTEHISKIDDAFKFTYTQSGAPTEVITFDLAASQLYYDNEQNRVYLLAHNTLFTYEMYMRNGSRQSDTFRDLSAIVYQITPDVRMTAYGRGGSSQDSRGDLILQDFIFTAPDGNLYWSNARRGMTYSAAPQSMATPLAAVPSETNLVQMRLNALYANGEIYMFDDHAQRLYKLNPKTREIKLIHTASFGTILDVEAHRDSFYILDKDHVYKMGIDGSTEIYVKMDDLLTMYHSRAELQEKLIENRLSWEGMSDDQKFLVSLLYADDTFHKKKHLMKLDRSGNLFVHFPNEYLYKVTLFE